MKVIRLISILIALCLSLATCAQQTYYQAPSSDKDYATLNVDSVEGGFLEADKPVVTIKSINGTPVEDWGTGFVGSFHGRAFEIPVGSVFIEIYEGYVRFNAKKGERYTLYYHELPHQLTLTVTNSMGEVVTSHDFQRQECSYNAQDTRLIDAIAFQDVGKVKQLLDDGVDPNRLECQAWHPLPLAAKENNMEILKLLLANGARADGFDGVKAMKYALKNDNLDMMNLLIDSGADINLRKDSFANSLLMDAAEQGKVRFVKFLLEHGAYTKFRAYTGKIAATLAKEAGYKDIADLINN